MENQYILLVEDEIVISLYIKKILQKEGYEVNNEHKNVDDAIQSIQNRRPDLVIIDIKLHGTKTGIDLAQFLLKYDSIPYIFITSYSDKLVLEQIKNVRPYGYLLKPIKKIMLINTVYLVLNNFFHRKIDTSRNPEPKENDVPYQIKITIDYINNHLDKKIDVKELAELTRWNIQHYIRIFKLQMGVTPYQYIIQSKINYAKVLLTQTDSPIEEIAINLGFVHYSVFYKIFVKHTEKSPNKYRSYTRANLS